MKEEFEKYSDLLNESFSQSMIKLQIKSEEQVLKNALKSYLGREATLDDVMKCKRVYKTNENHLDYWLQYENEVLGKVRFAFLGNAYTCEFTPTI